MSVLSFDKSGKSNYKALSAGGFTFIVSRDSELGGYTLHAEGITTYYTDTQNQTSKSWVVLKEAQRVAQSIEDTLYPRENGITLRKQNAEAHRMVQDLIKQGYGPQKKTFTPQEGTCVILVDSGKEAQVVEVKFLPNDKTRYVVRTLIDDVTISQPIRQLLPLEDGFQNITREKRREAARELHSA